MRALVIAMVSACGFSPGASSAHDDSGVHDGPPIDSAVDAPIDAPPMGANCFGHGFTVVCPTVLPTSPYSVTTTTTVDTDSNTCISLTPPNSNVCVVAGTTVTISSFLKAKGSRPLVVLALDTLDVTGAIDVYSTTGMPGAGSPGMPCGGVAGTVDGGGGFGGSFGSKGGDGGTGGSTAGDAIVPTALRGGCPGGLGKGTGGSAGLGGGAVALIAGHAISVFGTIDASGSFGTGSTVDNSGGNGGGAGGMIAFDSNTLSVMATTQIFANGGGGGGGNSVNGVNGNDGQDPTSTNGNGRGGAGGGLTGGDGGDGATLDATTRDPKPAKPGDDGDPGAGNGGGGGGFGVIKIFNAAPLSADDLKRFSPRPS